MGLVAMARAGARAAGLTRRRQESAMPVSLDLLVADAAADDEKVIVNRERLRMTWVLPPLTGGSGGLQNIARFVGALRAHGHRPTVHIMGSEGLSNAKLQSQVNSWFPELGEVINGVGTLTPGDVTVATSWATAYVVRSRAETAQRIYWVQDYEPMFYPAGTEAM